MLKLLKSLRLQRNLTQFDLSKLLGVHQSFVSKYESGERRIDVIELRTICKILNITLIEFIDKLEKKIK